VSLPVLSERDETDAPSDPYVIDGWSSRASRRGLPARSLRAARTLAEAIFTCDDGPPPAERLDWLIDDLADFFGHVTLRARLLFRACLATVFWLAPIAIGRFAPLSSLTIEERIRALEALERTPFSLPLLGAKAGLSVVYYEHPDAAAEIGWDQQCKKAREP
jgi:hypothetical protein